MQKTPLPPAMYHGANSFAKEHYRETTHAGLGCNNPVSDNRGASKYGRWQSPAPWDHHLHPPGLPDCAVACGAARLKRSNVRAIVLCNAPNELAQGTVAFPVGGDRKSVV